MLWTMMLVYNPVWPIGTNVPEPEMPPMNGNGMRPPTVPGGDRRVRLMLIKNIQVQRLRKL